MTSFRIFILAIVVISFNIKAQEVSKSAPGKGVWNFLTKNGPKFCKCTCGKAYETQRGKLLSGQYVESHQFPWLVLINIQEVASLTATLINERYIITSASQMIGLTPYDVKITVGEHNRCLSSVTAANLSVSAILINPDFDAVSRSNDIALLRLANVLEINRRVRSICLPQPGADYSRLVVGALGWGQSPILGQDISTTCRPRIANLPVLSRQICLQASYMNNISLKDKSCAGTLGATPVVCAADAGGPVQYHAHDGFYELVGVLSDSNTCSMGSPPTLFTRVNEHFEWIFENTRDSCFCIK